MTDNRHTARRLLAGLLAASLGTAAAPPVARAAELPSESAYRRRANAKDAEDAARAWLASGNLGRAINWIERLARSPGVSAAQLQWTDQQRQALQRALHDQGFGRILISVSPATARVEVDGRPLAPPGADHAVWLKEGPHHLSASADGHHPQERDVPLSRGEKRSVDLRLQAIVEPTLQLQVAPRAQLWIDGEARGEGERWQVPLRRGSHSVELRAPAHQAWQRTLDFADGEVKTLVVQLQPAAVAEGGRRPVASDVDRPVLESERRGDPLGLSRERPGRVSLPASGKGGEALGLPAKGAANAEAAPARPGAAGEPAAAAAAEESVAAEAASAPAEPWSDAAKGWLLAGPGLALLGGGAVLAMTAAADAEAVNQRPYGAADYDADYDAAGRKALIGYATAAVGGGLSAWGSWYLLAKRGAGPRGRGALLAGSGAAAVALAAWMFVDAQDVARSGASLPAGHPDVARREALGERNQLIAGGVAGAGAVLIGLGAWQLWGGSAAATSASGWRLTPLWTPQHTGAALAWAW